MADLLYEALQGVNFDDEAVELLLESQGLSNEIPTDVTEQQTSIITEEEDIFQCGKCKRQFTSFQLLLLHKKEHVQVPLENLDNHDILLSLDEGKDVTCSANEQRPITDSAFNQLTVDTLSADTSVIFNENDILSFAVNSGPLSLSPSLEMAPSFPYAVQPEEFLSPTTAETTINSIHKGKNNGSASYSYPGLDIQGADMFTPQLTENSTDNRLPSIHSITNDKNIEASVDVCSIQDINFPLPSTEETNDQYNMIYPEIGYTSGSGKNRTEQNINYEDAVLDNAATILLDYSNGQTMKANSMPLPCEEFPVQSTAGKHFGSKVQNENLFTQENIVIEYSDSCTQTIEKGVGLKKNKKTNTKKNKTIENSEVSEIEKNVTGNLSSHQRLTALNSKEENHQDSSAMLKCSFCTKLFTKNFDLQQHIRIHTGEKPFQCVVCGRAFTQKSNAKKHMKSHKVWPKHQTTLPKSAFQLPGKENDDGSQENRGTDAAAADAVLGYPTLQKSYACQFCDKIYSAYMELRGHMKIHSDQKVYKCIQKRCLHTFPDLESFLEHTNNHHTNDLQYRCHVCNRRFDTLEALGVHQYSHGNHARSANKSLGRKLVCCKCKRKFLSHAALKHHMDTSSHNFPCPYCGKVFTLEQFLRRHLTIHGPEKSFSCSICGKCFRVEMYLKSHMLIHTDEKPFACQHCGATFNRKDKLTRHIRIHQPIKKMKCPFHKYLGCSKEFTRQDKLKFHIISHTLPKPQRCKRCNKTFQWPSHLREHERLHRHKDLERTCSDCGLVFRSKVQVSSHQCISLVAAASEETSAVQRSSEDVLEVQSTSRSKRRRVKKGSKGETSKSSKVSLGGEAQKIKDLCDDNMSTIEVIVVPVSVNNPETIKNHSEDGTLYVTYPSTSKDISSSDLINTSDSLGESQYASFILSSNYQYDENIPEINIGNDCNDLAIS